MRVKLAVHRHRLPAASVLWAIPDDQVNPGTTISKLLSQIDEIIPLEADEWGFEDYVVEVDGFECMHFQPVGDVIKEGDLITIRPLQTPEVRGRKLSGRYQISENGQHLVDGVPFGRPLLRKPNRPRIRIPSKKRPQLLDEQTIEGELVDEEVVQQLLLTHGEQDPDSVDLSELKVTKKRKLNSSRRVSFEPTYDANVEIQDDADEEEDEDFEPGVEGSEEDDSEDENSEVNELNDEIDRMEDEAEEIEDVLQAIEDEIEQLDEEFAAKAAQQSKLPGAPTDGNQLKQRRIKDSMAKQSKESSVEDSADGESSSSIESDSDSSSSSDSDSGLDSSESDSSSDFDSESNDDSSTSSDDSEFDTKAPEKALPSKQQVSERKHSKNDAKSEPSKIPAPGEGKTATQKRNARRRQTAKLKAMIDKGALPSGASLDDLRALEAGISDTVTAQNTKASKLADAIEFQSRREKLLASLNAGGVDAHSLDPILDATEEVDQTEFKKRSLADDDTPSISPAGKRARLDVASTRRLVLGSLGIRSAKSSKEKSSSQAKSVNALPADEQVAKEVLSDSDAWKGKLRVTAVECVNEGVTLTPPPYPFVQRWDPAQQLRGKKRKRLTQYHDDQDEHTEYDESGVYIDGDDSQDVVLNYDENDEQRLENIAFDVPELPVDVEVLPAFLSEHILPGTIITFKQLEMGETTNWQPLISDYRTARIDSVVDDQQSFNITLALRDIPRKRDSYDEAGNRILSRFEIDDGEDDDSLDRGERVVKYSELIEPKLIAIADTEAKIVEQSAPEGVVENDYGLMAQDEAPIVQEEGAVTEDEVDSEASMEVDQDTTAEGVPNEQVADTSDTAEVEASTDDTVVISAEDGDEEDEGSEETEQKGRSCVHM